MFKKYTCLVIFLIACQKTYINGMEHNFVYSREEQSSSSESSEEYTKNFINSHHQLNNEENRQNFVIQPNVIHQKPIISNSIITFDESKRAANEISKDQQKSIFERINDEKNRIMMNNQMRNKKIDKFDRSENKIHSTYTPVEEYKSATKNNIDEKPIIPNTRKNKTHRLCEQKYMEYMTRIFNDDDIVADGSDLDFNGRTLAEPGEYPHMTAIGFEAFNQTTDYKCGGSLISENFVITAAHCTNLTGQRPTKVRIGDLNLMIEERYLEPQIRIIRRIYKHPDYRSNLYYNDIALLEMDSEVEFTEFVRPIRLWTDKELPPNIVVHAMGYGATAFGKAPTNRLTQMNLTIVANADCNRDMPETPDAPQGIIASVICAKDFLMKRDTCQGDSGGPLQLSLRGRRRRNRKHYHLVGITSYGIFCRSDYPSVYTRVSSFLDWIESIVWSS